MNNSEEIKNKLDKSREMLIQAEQLREDAERFEIEALTDVFLSAGIKFNKTVVISKETGKNGSSGSRRQPRKLA